MDRRRSTEVVGCGGRAGSESLFLSLSTVLLLSSLGPLNDLQNFVGGTTLERYFPVVTIDIYLGQFSIS